MHENDQATMKTRYCGHLYSRLWVKWTHLDQPDQVFYCMGRVPILKSTVSLFPWPCSVYGCRSSPYVGAFEVGGWKGGLSNISLLASSVGPFDGWLGRLTSSYWVLLSGKPNSKGDRLWLFWGLCCLYLPLKPQAIVVWYVWAMSKGGGLLADGQTWCR